MMSRIEFSKTLDRLGLSEAEAALHLSVNPRSVRRWSDGSNDVPASVEYALNAWEKLNELGLPWKPDAMPIWNLEERLKEEQIKLYREHSIELSRLIDKVKKRGGPTMQWDVDLERHKATLGPIEVSFYFLADEKNFSPQMYRRSDGKPDLQRDWPLVEDAFYCIAMAISRKGRGRREAQG